MQASRKQRQIRTGDYPPEARLCLGQEVVKARIAAGYRYRTDLASAIRDAGTKVSLRSLQALETGDASVGQAVLFAVASVLPRWTEDTPKAILEGVATRPTSASSAITDEQIIAMDSHGLADHYIRTEREYGSAAAEDWLFHAIVVRRDARRAAGRTMAADGS